MSSGKIWGHSGTGLATVATLCDFGFRVHPTQEIRISEDEEVLDFVEDF